MIAKTVPLRAPQSIYEQLASLYSRRSALEQLIRNLESYAEWQAKTGQTEAPKRA